MLKRNNKGFTLIEIIISIAVLSIISAIFLELFIKADAVQKQGECIDNQVFLISNLMEMLMAEKDFAGFIEQSEPAAERMANGKRELDFYYNKELQPVDKEESVYYLWVVIEQKKMLRTGTLCSVTVSAFKDKEEVPLQITTSFYERKGE